MRDDDGRIIYGLSALTVTLRGRKRTRFYATFSKPRKWIGIDDLNRSIYRFLEWVASGCTTTRSSDLPQDGWGLMPAYLRKTDHEYLIPMYLFGMRDMGVDFLEPQNVPDWLTGRRVKSAPLAVSTSGMVHRLRFRDRDNSMARNLMQNTGMELNESALQAVSGLVRAIQPPPGLPSVGRQQLFAIRNAILNAIPGGRKWRPLWKDEIERILVLVQEIRVKKHHESPKAVDLDRWARHLVNQVMENLQTTGDSPPNLDDELQQWAKSGLEQVADAGVVKASELIAPQLEAYAIGYIAGRSSTT